MGCTLRANGCAALVAGVLLGGCGERAHDDAPAHPVAQAQAPDAAVLAVGPDTRALGAGAFGASCGIRALEQDMLQRLNAARAAGRSCGGRAMPPALPLAWDPSLQAAASAHAQDMARRNYFGHRSPDGSSVHQRVTAAKYPWKTVAENIAGGEASPPGVMRHWLASPGHCANIMDPAFEEVAVACVEQPGSEWGTYWTMVLGRKR